MGVLFEQMDVFSILQEKSPSACFMEKPEITNKRRQIKAISLGFLLGCFYNGILQDGTGAARSPTCRVI